MEYYPISKDELVKQSKNRHGKEVYDTLTEIIEKGIPLCRIEDSYYNNNNDLRRAIQTIIEYNNLPLHVFMKYSKTYVEKE